MDKVKLVLDVTQRLLEVCENLQCLSDSVRSVCTTIKEGLSVMTLRIEAEEAEKPIALEKVRGVLAEKSKAGYNAEVKALIQKYDAKCLSEINPKNFGSILKEAEAIGNE